jgi:hypothetical protein
VKAGLVFSLLLSVVPASNGDGSILSPGHKTEPPAFSWVIAGAVTARPGRTPLAGCRVSVLETELAAATNAEGRYRIEKVPPGTWQVLFEKDGYLPEIRRVRTGGPAGAEVRADADLEPLAKEVTVVADAFTRTETDASSRRELTGQQVREIPGTFEDITRAIQVLPGVAATGDFKNDLIVRGGSPSENMFMIDMIQVPGLSHFGSQNSGGGAMGLLGASVVQDLEFFSGGFPAYYGDKLSSVTRVRLREGARKGLHGQAAFSLLGAGLNAEGPLFSERGSWLVSGRKDYFSVIPRDWTIDLTVVPDFEDVLAKAAYDLSSRVQVSALGLWARDSLHIEEADDPPDRRMKIDIGDGLDVAGATVKALLGRGGVAYFTLSRTDNRYTYRLVSGGLERYTIRSDDDESTGRVDVEYYVLPKLQVLGGVSYKWLEARHRMYYRGGYLVIDRMGFRYTRVNTDQSLASGKTAVYLQASYPVTARLKATAGLRYDYMTYIRKGTTSPRLGLTYAFGTATNLHVSYGVHYQSPETFWLASHPGNTALLPVKSEHFVLGGEHDFGGALRVRAEAFAKTYRHYPVDPSNPHLTLANLGGSIVPTFFGSKLLSAGQGYARGFEVSAEKPLLGRLSWLLAYSYSVVKYRALDGVMRNGDFDYRHSLNVVGLYRLSSSWDVGFKWRLAGGQPYTPFDLQLSTLRDNSYFDMTKINTLRYPAYHRLDVRVEKSFVFKKWRLAGYLDVQNLYNRKNVYYKYWDDGQEHTVHYLPLVPFLGLQASF